MSSPAAGGLTVALLKDINAAFNSRDVRDGRILTKDTYWKLVEHSERL